MVLIPVLMMKTPKIIWCCQKQSFFISTKVGEIDWFEMYFMVSMCIYMSYTDLYRYTFLRLMKINLHAILSEACTPRCQRSRTWLLPEIERLVLTRRVHSLPPSLLCQTLHLPPSSHPTSHLLYISLTPLLLPHGLIHSWYLNNSDPELKMSCTPVSLLAVLSLLFVLSCEFDAEDSTLLDLLTINDSCSFLRVFVLSDLVSPEAESAAVAGRKSNTEGDLLHLLKRHSCTALQHACMLWSDWTSSCSHRRSTQEGLHEGGRRFQLL